MGAIMVEAFLNSNDPIWEVLLRFGYNLLVLYVLIKVIYFNNSDKNKHVFAFFMMGIVIFLVCIVLKGVELQIGMAFGLFAVFSIIRFRTKNITIKDMAYLFSIVGVSAINALFVFPHPIRGAIIINLILISSAYILEKTFGKEDDKKVEKQLEKSGLMVPVLYGRLELLDPDKLDELLSDVSSQTGLEINKIEIRSIDLIEKKVMLDVQIKPKEKDELHTS